VGVMGEMSKVTYCFFFGVFLRAGWGFWSDFDGFFGCSFWLFWLLFGANFVWECYLMFDLLMFWFFSSLFYLWVWMV
jgi:hypothetical protein